MSKKLDNLNIFFVIGKDFNLNHRAIRFALTLSGKGVSTYIISPNLKVNIHCKAYSKFSDLLNDLNMNLFSNIQEDIVGASNDLDKNLVEQEVKKLYDLKPDIIYSFGELALEIVGNAFSYYRDKSYLCLWLHDLTKGIHRFSEFKDDFHKKKFERRKKYFDQIDLISTDTEEKSLLLFENYNLPNNPLIIEDFPLEDLIKYFKTKKTKPKDNSINIFYNGRSDNLSFIRKIINFIKDKENCFLFIRVNNNNDSLAIKEFYSSDSLLQKRIEFLPSLFNTNFSNYIPHLDYVIFSSNDKLLCSSSFYDLAISYYFGAKLIIPYTYHLDKSLQKIIKHCNYQDYLRDDFKFKLLDPASEIDILDSPDKSKFIWQESTLDQLISNIEYLLYRIEIRDPVKNNLNVNQSRILHGLTGAAGLPWMLSRAQREWGAKSDTLIMNGNKFGYKTDKQILDISFKSLSNLLKTNSKQYDIFQFYFRSFFFNKISLSFPTALDMLALRAAGKRICVYTMGSEARFHSMYKKFSKFNYVDENPGNVVNFPENTQRRLMMILESLSNQIVVSDPEMESYLPGKPIIERAIDLKHWDFISPVRNATPVIVHAPSRRIVKGTDYVEKAIENLKEENLNFKYKVIEGLTHKEANELYKEADILIDQLRIGWYGFLSVEAMAMGKAVVCYIREDLLDNFGPDGPPLAVANPDTITDTLRSLINSYELREYYAYKGRNYVENVHDSKVIAKKFLNLYQDIISNPNEIDISYLSKFISDQYNQIQKGK